MRIKRFKENATEKIFFGVYDFYDKELISEVLKIEGAFKKSKYILVPATPETKRRLDVLRDDDYMFKELLQDEELEEEDSEIDSDKLSNESYYKRASFKNQLYSNMRGTWD